MAGRPTKTEAVVKAAAPKARIRKAKSEKARAEAFIATAREVTATTSERKTPKANRKDPWGHVTKEQIEEARDELRLSWRDIAAKLELGSPSTARKAYTALTGRPHNSAAPVKERAPRGVGTNRPAPTFRPQWTSATLHEEVLEAIRGRILTVDRGNGFTEEIRISSGLELVGKGKDAVGVVTKVLHYIGETTRSGKACEPYIEVTEADTCARRSIRVDKILSVR